MSNVISNTSNLLQNVQIKEICAPAEALFPVISSIGGDQGWYYANALWQFRGFLDKLIGGVGLRRGRRHPITLVAGEPLDFWRVENIEPNCHLRLRAEIKLPGNAWLDFRIEPTDQHNCRLIQTAIYHPGGYLGTLYWYVLYPIHIILFRGLANAMKQRAEFHSTWLPST